MSIYYTQIRELLGTVAIVRVDDDGTPWWLGDGEQDAGYLAWLAEGNTPEEWNPDATQ